MLSIASSESGAWLGSLPVPSFCTKLDNEFLMIALRIALELRLCVPIVVEHTCICGAVVDVYGSHSLSCRCSGDRIPRQSVVNETVCHDLMSGVYLLFWSLWMDGKRPDGMSLIPWWYCLATLPVSKCSSWPSNMSTFSRDSSRLANSS